MIKRMTATAKVSEGKLVSLYLDINPVPTLAEWSYCIQEASSVCLELAKEKQDGEIIHYHMDFNSENIDQSLE